MRRIVLRLVLGIALFAIEIGTAQAQAARVFMKMDGFPGDVPSPSGYLAWSYVTQWSFGQGLATAGARPLVVTKHVDRSSPNLAAAAATGVGMKNAVLDVMKTFPNGNESLFYRIIVHDVVVRNYSVSGSVPNNTSEALKPIVETLELGYSRIEWYTFSLSNGVVVLVSQAKFDATKNALYP